MPVEQILQSSLWARDLSADQLARVQIELVVRPVPEGGYVCRKGELADTWFGVSQGLVKINTVSEAGKSVTFTGVPPGGWFGEGSLLKREPRRYDVVALRDSQIACMPKTTFQWLLDSSIAFNRFLLVQLNERLGQFIGAVEHERLLDTDARVARFLASMFNPVLYPGIGLRLEISQEEIGFLAGISRQRANLALKVLEQAGLLRVDYGEITILDLEGLRRFEGL